MVACRLAINSKGRQPFAGDIAEAQGEALFCQGNEVIIIATKALRGHSLAGDLLTREHGHGLGHKIELKLDHLATLFLHAQESLFFFVEGAFSTICGDCAAMRPSKRRSSEVNPPHSLLLLQMVRMPVCSDMISRGTHSNERMDFSPSAPGKRASCAGSLITSGCLRSSSQAYKFCSGEWPLWGRR